MTARIIAVIIRKDLKAFGRDRFFVTMTAIGLIAYIAVFWLLPSSVDETLAMGVYESGGTEVTVYLDSTPGLAPVVFGSAEELATAVEDGDMIIGLAFPAGFVADVAAGDQVTVEVIVPADIPEEFGHLAGGIVDRIAVEFGGSASGAEAITTTTVLGTDRLGDQVSLQEQMRPMLAFFVLMVETLALASLVASEVQARTAVAVLATPATIADFLAAKGLFGTALAFAEAALLMGLIGGLGANPPLILVVLLLGAVLVTGLGMVAGSFGKDFLGVLFFSMALMIPLMIPAFGVLFPGTQAAWVRLLPSFGLVDAVVGVTTNGDGWGETAPALALLAAWGAASFVAGSAILRRRVASL